MSKIIKNILRSIIISITIVTLVTLLLLILLSTSPVQTWLSKRATAYLSDYIHSSITLEKIKFTFFNRLIINNLLVKDQNYDTLLFAPELKVNVKKIHPGNINFGRVVVTRPEFYLITDSSGMLNLKWYLDMLKKNEKTSEPQRSKVNINRVSVTDGRLRIEKKIRPGSKTPVDFNNLRIDSLNAVIDNLEVTNDSVSMSINGLRFRESCGFGLKNMTTALSVYRGNIILNDAAIESDLSVLSAPFIAILPDSPGSYKDFAGSVRLDIKLTSSKISGTELKYFVPLKTLPSNVIGFTGSITGPVSELRGKNIQISIPDKTVFDLNFSLSGLPDIKNTFIFFEVNRFETISSDIEKLRFKASSPVILPAYLKEAGKISFTGSFTGFTTDFVTYGRLNTSLGTISSDISLRPEGSGRFRIKGLLRGEEIDIGKISGNSTLLGKATMISNIDGETESFKTFSVKLNSMVDSIEFNRYKYRNIGLKGYFTDKMWDGTIKVEDENIKMELLGMFDFSKDLPEFDFTLNLRNADLFRLNIDKKDSTSAASMLVTANFSGNNIDNLDGEIRVLNSGFRKYGKNLEVYDLSLKTYYQNNKNNLILNTDFLDAEIHGQYNFSSFGNEIRRMLATIFPSRFISPLVDVVPAGNNFDFKIDFKKINALNNFLKTGISVSENSFIQGFVRHDTLVTINGQVKNLGIKNNYFSNLSFEMNYNDSVFFSGISTSSLNLTNLTELKNLKMNFSSYSDHFKTSITWDDKSRVSNRGFFEADGKFASDGEPGENSLLKITILPGEVYINNNRWEIKPAEINIDSSLIKISRFLVSNDKNNYFSVEGSASNDLKDTIHIKIDGINISGLNKLFEENDTKPENKLHLSIGGILGGKISLTNIYKNFMFESDLRVHGFALLDNEYGELRIGSAWNTDERVADIEINNNLEGKRIIDIKGYYNPENRFLDITAKADKLPMEILNPLLKTFASEINGRITGRVRLSGRLDNTALTGSLFADNGSIKVDYLQSRFRFSDSIRFDPGAIRFNNIVFRDERGNTGTLNGAVYHKSFKDYSVDLTVKTNDCLVMNTKEKDNELFYGTAYATGVTTIKTQGNALRFDISAKTGRNTKFFIPLNTGMSITESSFITFVSHAAGDEKVSAAVLELQEPPQPKTSLEIVFDLEVTPDAEVQLLMDPKAGDIMKGSGSGNLNISLDRKGFFRIFGDYTIETGDYLFTLGNLINKPFSVQSGGKITFNGELDKAEINIRAAYRTKASLYEIMPGILPDEKLKERIPVECQLVLTGKLFNPVVGFDIYLPTADEETRAYLRSMIKSEEEMSRQFLFLLVMNSFYADPSAGSQMKPASMGFTTAGVTTIEMLSNQLSNWLSQISKDFDIGVVYRPGSSAMPNSQELQVALSTQLLNDRVIINGNFDVAGNQAAGSLGTSSTNTVTGAFDIEYKISERLRFKFFNRSNDNLYIDKGVQYTQGIGLFYRQEFDRFRDIFIKKEKSPVRKEDEIKMVDK